MTMEQPQGQTYLGNKVLLIRAGQDIGLSPAQFALGEVGIHLVSIEVSIIGLAVGIVEPQDFLLGQNAGVVGLDGGSVQGGLSVQQEDVPILHMPAHLGPERSKGGWSVTTSAVSLQCPGLPSAWSVRGFRAPRVLLKQIKGDFLVWSETQEISEK